MEIHVRDTKQRSNCREHYSLNWLDDRSPQFSDKLSEVSSRFAGPGPQWADRPKNSGVQSPEAESTISTILEHILENPRGNV